MKKSATGALRSVPRRSKVGPRARPPLRATSSLSSCASCASRARDDADTPGPDATTCPCEPLDGPCPPLGDRAGTTQPGGPIFILWPPRQNATEAGPGPKECPYRNPRHLARPSAAVDEAASDRTRSSPVFTLPTRRSNRGISPVRPSWMGRCPGAPRAVCTKVHAPARPISSSKASPGTPPSRWRRGSPASSQRVSLCRRPCSLWPPSTPSSHRIRPPA